MPGISQKQYRETVEANIRLLTENENANARIEVLLDTVARLRKANHEHKLECTRAWNEYHTVYTEYELIREDLEKCRVAYKAEYNRRKTAERTVILGNYNPNGIE